MTGGGVTGRCGGGGTASLITAEIRRGEDRIGTVGACKTSRGLASMKPLP